MYRLTSLCVCLLPSISVAQPPAKYAEAIKGLEALIERERLEAGIPGLSVAIVEGDAIIWSRGFGHADLAKTKPATPDTVYRVGSLSELLTRIAILQLVEEKKLDLDKPVTDYLPDFKPGNPWKTAVTLRHLMTYQSGLVKQPPVGNYFDPNPPSLEKTVASLNETSLVSEPGKGFTRGEAEIAVLGRVLEKVDGRPFPTAIRERVLGPLKMTASACEPTAAVKTNLAEGLMIQTAARPGLRRSRSHGPGLPLYSTANDLALRLAICTLKTGTCSEANPFGGHRKYPTVFSAVISTMR